MPRSYVVTGGASGVGAAVVRLLLQDGAAVVSLDLEDTAPDGAIAVRGSAGDEEHGSPRGTRRSEEGRVLGLGQQRRHVRGR
jgi:NAD(P)-dependent dehydrogenase (short-subunit alcohol dehydrogenase family)